MFWVFDWVDVFQKFGLRTLRWKYHEIFILMQEIKRI